FGAGLTWGAAHIKWGQRVTPLASSDASLPETNKTALELLAVAVHYCKEKSEAACL
ncbi:3-oxoacyl-ACP synthase, partial [Vibrio genomosp. F10 str. 9ZD137]